MIVSISSDRQQIEQPVGQMLQGEPPGG
jgi:hypothetical protein